MSYPTVEQELAAACRACDDSIALLVVTNTPTATDWINLRAARHLARRALARYDASANRPGEQQEATP